MKTPGDYANQVQGDRALSHAKWCEIRDTIAAAMADARRAALELASEHLKAQAARWVRVAEDNQHRTDAPSRAVAVELACQADIVRALLDHAKVPA